ncbi:MAG: hypothetical protein LQ346_008177 [Caloplaca aetnensis]|nr:MAG: hypothetical protein LQ346_008177 [Caloplaca aetnensis]
MPSVSSPFGHREDNIEYRDSIVESNSSPAAVTDECDVDSESDSLARYYSNVAPSPINAWAQICNADYPRRPLSTSTTSSSKSLQFVIKHFTDSDGETHEQVAAHPLVQRRTTTYDLAVEAAAGVPEGNESQGQILTEAHLIRLPKSVSSVYLQLYGCSLVVPTREQSEEARLNREDPPVVTWEHSKGPFGYEQHQRNYHQRCQEQHQPSQKRESGDDWDFVQRVERDGKIEMKEAKYRIGMKAS